MTKTLKMYIDYNEAKALAEGKQVNLGKLHLIGGGVEIILIPRKETDYEYLLNRLSSLDNSSIMPEEKK